jgi:hypothetical protein
MEISGTFAWVDAYAGPRHSKKILRTNPTNSKHGDSQTDWVSDSELDTFASVSNESISRGGGRGVACCDTTVCFHPWRNWQNCRNGSIRFLGNGWAVGWYVVDRSGKD